MFGAGCKTTWYLGGVWEGKFVANKVLWYLALGKEGLLEALKGLKNKFSWCLRGPWEGGFASIRFFGNWCLWRRLHIVYKLYKLVSHSEAKKTYPTKRLGMLEQRTYQLGTSLKKFIYAFSLLFLFVCLCYLFLLFDLYTYLITLCLTWSLLRVK